MRCDIDVLRCSDNIESDPDSVFLINNNYSRAPNFTPRLLCSWRQLTAKIPSYKWRSRMPPSLNNDKVRLRPSWVPLSASPMSSWAACTHRSIRTKCLLANFNEVSLLPPDPWSLASLTQSEAAHSHSWKQAGLRVELVSDPLCHWPRPSSQFSDTFFLERKTFSCSAFETPADLMVGVLTPLLLGPLVAITFKNRISANLTPGLLSTSRVWQTWIWISLRHFLAMWPCTKVSFPFPVKWRC